MSVDTRTNNLVINKLTKQQFDSIQNPSETELYLITDDDDYVPKTRKVNNKALSSDITLTASDVGAIDSVKTLKTDNTTTQTASSSESLSGSGTINLHKVSKTGSYSDLLNKPTIPATNVIPATTTANKVLISTTTSGTAKWSDFSSAGLLKTNTSGVITVDTTTYYSKPSGGIPSTDLAESYYLASNPSGYTSNAGTVTSVRVQATSPVQSSTSTAQSTSLNTTISLANAYGDTKNPYGTKTANYVLAGPTSGSAAVPTFRALVKADIPLASETAASGGTTTSLVTTGEKYTWNNKQDALPSQSGNSGKFLSTNGTSMSWAEASVTIDNSTITKNSSNQIQTVGFKDVRTSNTLKMWTGTRAQYDAIATKDSNTVYNVTDDYDDVSLSTILNTLYPVGSIYIGTMATCPLEAAGIGTWEKIEDKFLLGSSSTYTLNSTGGEATHTLSINEMPYHGHQIRVWNNAGTTASAYYYNGNTKVTVSNGLRMSGSWQSSSFVAAQSGVGDQAGGTDRVGGGAAHNNMPPYLSVNIWRRTA